MNPTTTHRRTRAVALIVAGGVYALSGIHSGTTKTNTHHTDPAGQLIALTNHARRHAGHHPLVVDPALSHLALDWATRLSTEEPLRHRPGLGQHAWDLGIQFDTIGENIGRANTPEQMHRALMASPTHRDNILNPVWTRVGVGVVRLGDGQLLAVFNFADRAPTRT